MCSNGWSLATCSRRAWIIRVTLPPVGLISTFSPCAKAHGGRPCQVPLLCSRGTEALVEISPLWHAWLTICSCVDCWQKCSPPTTSSRPSPCGCGAWSTSTTSSARSTSASGSKARHRRPCPAVPAYRAPAVRLRGDAGAGRVDRQTACALLPVLTVRRMGRAGQGSRPWALALQRLVPVRPRRPEFARY